MRVWLALALIAYRSTDAGPYSPTVEAKRNTVHARELNAEAADALPTDLAEAERLLREALSAVPVHGSVRAEGSGERVAEVALVSVR